VQLSEQNKGIRRKDREPAGQSSQVLVGRRVRRMPQRGATGIDAERRCTDDLDRGGVRVTTREQPQLMLKLDNDTAADGGVQVHLNRLAEMVQGTHHRARIRVRVRSTCGLLQDGAGPISDSRLAADTRADTWRPTPHSITSSPRGTDEQPHQDPTGIECRIGPLGKR
jgi:hypothetical protein